MALLFNPPLNPHEASVFESLKKSFGGTVTNPAYLAVQHRDHAERILADWCSKHEMRHWPSWITGWKTDYDARQASRRKSGDVHEHDRSEGLELRPGSGCSGGPLLGGGGRDGAAPGTVSAGVEG